MVGIFNNLWFPGFCNIYLFPSGEFASVSAKSRCESCVVKCIGWVRVWLRECDGTSLQYSCLENPMNGGAWWAAVHGVAKSWTWLSDFIFIFSLSCIGEGNGNPLQCSCLENPRDGGAWWAAVYGVAQSQTRLKWLSSSSSSSVYEMLINCLLLVFSIPAI